MSDWLLGWRKSVLSFKAFWQVDTVEPSRVGMDLLGL